MMTKNRSLPKPVARRAQPTLRHLLMEAHEELKHIRKELKIMTKQIDDLTAKLTAEETVEASVITLLGTLKGELDAALATNDTAALQALSDKIGTDTDALAAAVTANTPAAPKGA